MSFQAREGPARARSGHRPAPPTCGAGIRAARRFFAFLLPTFALVFSSTSPADPPPVTPTPTPFHRPVLLEEFGGTYCAPCYGVSNALTRIQAEYSRDEVLVISNHVYDEFTLPFVEERYEQLGSIGVPMILINQFQIYLGGRTQAEGEAGIQAIYDILQVLIRHEQPRPYIDSLARFTLSLDGSVGPVDPWMDLTITVNPGHPRTIRAVFLILEDGIPFTGQNGLTTQDSTVRLLVGARDLDLSSEQTLTVSVNHAGTVPHSNASRLHPAVYLADPEVLALKGRFDLRNAVPDWTLYE